MTARTIHISARALADMRKFHNALRILLNIDADEFLQATHGIDTMPGIDTGEWREWLEFRANPWRWFIEAPTAQAEALWNIIEARQS